ncbi:DUF2484 family protein [Jannaschia sp. 2305UL9-9]|uniref:DUF2484 family protein n=1 Tax=Jannaschia sp. 2305UL9-9 TaxID=3121638 RepID=UPI0035281EA9
MFGQRKTAIALIALCLWVVVAWIAMVSLSSRQSWPAAYVLIAAGLPIVIGLGATMGWPWAMLGVMTMAAVLRWPLRYLWRWVARVLWKSGAE